MKKKIINIKDVANEAGVSAQTVSNYLNNKCNIKEDKKNRIGKAIKKLNFSRNIIARNLRIGKKFNIIAVVTPEIDNPFYSTILEGIEDTLSKKGYTAFFINSGYNKIMLEKELYQVLKYTDGIIFCTDKIEDKEIIDLIRKGIYIVVLDNKIENGIIPSVEVNNYEAVYEGINYLINMGHKNIYYFSEPLILGIIKDRYEAYKKCLKDNNIRFDKSKVFIDKQFKISKRETGYLVMKDVMKNIEVPAAIFASSDLIILGSMKAALESGLKIPEDISFLGYEDLFFCDFLSPPLTSISHPKKDMGKIGAEIMVDLLNGVKLKEQRIIIKTEIIERSSVKKISPI